MLRSIENSGDANLGRARANAMAGIPLPWLPPWQSKVVIIKFHIMSRYLNCPPDATNDLSMPCQEQWTDAANDREPEKSA